MLRPDRGIERVYLHRAPVDMRRQIDVLAILARDVIKADPGSHPHHPEVRARGRDQRRADDILELLVR
jgi:hypothetical protein